MTDKKLLEDIKEGLEVDEKEKITQEVIYTAWYAGYVEGVRYRNLYKETTEEECDEARKYIHNFKEKESLVKEQINWKEITEVLIKKLKMDKDDLASFKDAVDEKLSEL